MRLYAVFFHFSPQRPERRAREAGPEEAAA